MIRPSTERFITGSSVRDAARKLVEKEESKTPELQKPLAPRRRRLEPILEDTTELRRSPRPETSESRKKTPAAESPKRGATAEAIAKHLEECKQKAEAQRQALLAQFKITPASPLPPKHP
jgi:hypothetical protein